MLYLYVDAFEFCEYSQHVGDTQRYFSQNIESLSIFLSEALEKRRLTIPRKLPRPAILKDNRRFDQVQALKQAQYRNLPAGLAQASRGLFGHFALLHA